ncbi:hypothetical protein B0I37DRAFT_47475 [Chaetomium sp. MPI-CAGE-AT-0009]|nr:hypothetical protein B0I37DRAFT_47475 [Chaetomium sp. MPI-CAGE-AT-0009]
MRSGKRSACVHPSLVPVHRGEQEQTYQDTSCGVTRRSGLGARPRLGTISGLADFEDGTHYTVGDGEDVSRDADSRGLQPTTRHPHAMLCNYRKCRGGWFWLVDELMRPCTQSKIPPEPPKIPHFQRLRSGIEATRRAFRPRGRWGCPHGSCARLCCPLGRRWRNIVIQEVEANLAAPCYTSATPASAVGDRTNDNDVRRGLRMHRRQLMQIRAI